MPLVVNTHVVPTTVYHIAGPSPQAPLVYLIPGNPGLSEFYESFLEELKILQPSFEYLCPSHIGFDTLTQSSYGIQGGDVSHTLDEQIDHKISLLKEWVRDSNIKAGFASAPSKAPPRQVVLMGHSVGSWMVQRIAVAFANDSSVEVKFIALLTPTIVDIAKSLRGSKLSAASGYLSDPGYYLSRFSQILNWTIPRSYLKSGLSYIMGSPPDVALNAALSLITKPRIIKQAVDMGKEEMTRIGSEIEPEDIAGFWSEQAGYKIWMFFVYDDHWVNTDTRQQLISHFEETPHVESVVEEGDKSIAHAFCVRDNKHVATLVSDQMNMIEFSSLPSSTAASHYKGALTDDATVIFKNKEGQGETEVIAVDVAGRAD